jgi:hypothetical protein
VGCSPQTAAPPPPLHSTDAMYLTPFSTPVLYSAPDGKGIYTTHEPVLIPEKPPMPEIEVTRSLIGTEGKVYTTPYMQLSGPISWWGHLLDAEYPEKGRRVLSYAGPKLRYFLQPDFSYGDVLSHNEVYYRGGCLGIAPGPVLGACLRYMAYFDPITLITADAWHLLVMTYVGGGDRLYKRLMPAGPIRADKLTDDLRKAGMALYHAEINPNGWVEMGRFSNQGSDYAAPETPWFFNQSGTEAVCMRRQSYTFNNGGADVEEDRLQRLSCTVSTSSASFSNVGNLAPYEHKEVHSKEMTGAFTEVAHAPAGRHSWETTKVDVLLTCTGTQNVFSDFIDDQEWTASVEYNCYRSHTQFYAFGIDDPIDFPGTEDSCNTGFWADTYSPTIVGATSFAAFVYVPATEPIVFVEDNRPGPWFGSRALVFMYIGPNNDPKFSSLALYDQDSGSATEFEGFPEQADDPFFFFYKFKTNTLRGGFDIRKLLAVVSENYTYSTVSGAGGTLRRVEQNQSMLYTQQNPSGETLASITRPPTTGTFNFFWPLAEFLSWGAPNFSATVIRMTYEGVWALDNREGEAQVPGSMTFYHDNLGDLTKGWPLLPVMLYGPVSADCLGNAVITEFSAWAVDMEVPEIEGGNDYVVVSKTSWGGTVPAYTEYSPPAYPLGTC